MRTARKVTFAASAALLACVGIGVAPAGAAPASSAAACTPKTNLEAIIDDSGSMSSSDPSDLRIRAMELLIDTQGNSSAPWARSSSAATPSLYSDPA